MRCPHCGDSFTPQWSSTKLLRGDPDINGEWFLKWTACPSCSRLVAVLYDRWLAGTVIQETNHLSAYPAVPSRVVAEEVDATYADDFREASATLQVSPKASAALSRRLLQRLLREKGQVKPANLMAEIDEIREKNILPVGLADELHSIRHVGNFAAHPLKDTETEVVADVEVGEAEWLLDLLEELLEAFIVAPTKREARRQALSSKLEGVGKKPLDEPSSEAAG